MQDFIKTISSYNLFNYLLPGVIFSAIATEISEYSFIQSDVIVGVFVYYFAGMVISRIGSLIIEPILRKIGFIKFSDYPDYIKGVMLDSKIETLSEANNTYRTMIALFATILLLKFFEYMKVLFPCLAEIDSLLLVALLFFMFLFSYRKQTTYVQKRVETSLREDTNLGKLNDDGAGNA